MELSGIDGSYTELTVEKAQELYTLGKRVWAQCLWTGSEQPAPRINNLRIAEQAGFILVGYISVTGAHPGEWHVSCGYAGVPDDLWKKLIAVIVDVELPGISPQTVRNAVAALDVAGKPIKTIYTSRHAWLDLMGDPPGFGDCWLFDANWDGTAKLTPPSYGTWAGLFAKQYSGGTDLNGVFVDLDVFNRELLAPEEGNVDVEARRENSVNTAKGMVQAAALEDDMKLLIDRLVYFQILPAGTAPRYPSINTASQAQTGGS